MSQPEQEPVIDRAEDDVDVSVPVDQRVEDEDVDATEVDEDPTLPSQRKS